MKNLIKLSVLSASLVAAGIAQADEAHLIGAVEEVCELSLSATDLDFGQNPQMGDMVNANVSVQCNDGDGAVLKVTSSEGGLESDDNEDLSVEYTADVTVGATTVSLTTTPGVGQNDEFEEANIGGSAALAAGIGGTLKVTLEGTPLFAGGYSDTLSVDLTAR